MRFQNKIGTVLWIFFLSTIIISCNYYDDKEPYKANISGKAGEVIIIINEKLWEGMVGDTIFYSLSVPFGVMPQDEAIFDVVQIPHEAFKNIFKTHRNLIFIDIGIQNTESKVTKSTDKWANSQLVYHFYAPNDTAFIAIWEKYKDNIIETIFNEEMIRYRNAFVGFQNDEAKQKILNKYNLSIDLTTEYSIDVLDDHFCWISRETQISSQGIFIYDYPYTDSNTFTLDYLVEKRDEITKANVPGPNDGTYMQTETRVPIYFEETTINGNYAFLMRGLWRTENYFLGGPFVSITMLDEQRNRIVTVETYIYAGKQKKKLYLWQTESIIRTLEIKK